MRSKESLASKALREVLHEADVLLIHPPFSELVFPSLGLHLLQACGSRAGFRVQVLYANLLLASILGEDNYDRVCNAPMGAFAGERFFARCAYGLPRLGRRARGMFESTWVIDWKTELRFDIGFRPERAVTRNALRRLESKAEDFTALVAGAICEWSYKIIGCSTTFEQTSAGVALLNGVKRLRPELVTILGGANCEGEMARGIASLGARIDYIFSGESEGTFLEFVRTVLAGSRPNDAIIQGKPCRDMDALPTPDYSEYYEQRKRFLPRSPAPPAETEILSETSRGCWWGEKQHCTFCGLNGEGMAFRQKSPSRVIEELRVLSGANPTRRIHFTDNIMPYRYFQTLLPRLSAELPGLNLFYEQKANLSLANVLALKNAGITAIQPGIEALSSSLLKLMKKGVQARQNLMLLRYGRVAGVQMVWNLLWGFPGDELKTYEETLALIPLLHHLEPPASMCHLSIDRFSPYFSRPAEFGIRRTRPVAGYFDIFPKAADIHSLAYHFTGLFDCASHEHLDVILELWRAVKRWQSAWGPRGLEPKEDLRLFRERGSYMLEDTRRLARNPRIRVLERRQASALIAPRLYSASDLQAWALGEKLAVLADGWFVPLPVAVPEVFLKLMENEAEEADKFNSVERPRAELYQIAGQAGSSA